MNERYKKIYTCTPVAFHANEHFFIRDTGLIATNLRKMGVESKCIMPLPWHEDDMPEHVIRTELKNLSSVEWWRSLGIDGLVLYSWGAPRYTAIARAVKKAGIRLHIHMDTSGAFIPNYRNPVSIFRKLRDRLRLVAHNVFRSRHLSYADVVTAGPEAILRISKMLFFGKWLVDKSFPMACPVDPIMRYEGEEKRNMILCIGRWDGIFQKRPEVLMKTLECYYAQGGSAETYIFGKLTETLTSWHAGLPPDVAEKIRLVGYVLNHELKKYYQTARVILCPSRYEGSHNVSAEAICCGCSLVVPNRPLPMSTVMWYTTKDSGTVSREDTPESLAEALHHEMSLWHSGKRNPHTIAAAWHPYFHVDKVFNKIFE